jgi:hypothetical protein
VRIGGSEEGGCRWRCRFNASVLAREERRQDEALSKDEPETTRSSWLYSMGRKRDMERRRREERQHWGEER